MADSSCAPEERASPLPRCQRWRFLSCVTYCRVSAVVYMGRHVPMIIRRTKDFYYRRCTAVRTRFVIPTGLADMVLGIRPVLGEIAADFALGTSSLI